MKQLSELQLIGIWRALGGGDLRNGRGRAFWRGGDGYTVALDLEQGRWFDHRDQRGGGALALVETALACNRAEALRWLETHCGLDRRQPITEQQQRTRAQAPRLAERVADFLRGLWLTATPIGARLLRNSTARDIVERWHATEPGRRVELERLGREHQQHAEQMTRFLVELIAAAASANSERRAA